MSRPIRRILIANRGEIACRIVATARSMGIETVTVYAPDEQDLPHAYAGDFSVVLAGASLAETYLNIPAILAAAKQSGADAIHPGYGFLSENSGFAAAVQQAGLTFVGPSAKVIGEMGDKAASRILCNGIGVPTVPGYDGASTDIAELARIADSIGYPVLVKAAAGGGGKGMRVVEKPAELQSALELARDEAKSAFGDDRVLLEKYLLEPRHIEMQVFSDSHGNHVHLFERECSIQRRHQKIIEESPSPSLPAATLAAMAQAVTTITRHIGYTGAGTVEFILDREGNFYFLEMNTRLQVEHPVTEMVTGLDLVRWQILVAQGEALPLKQEAILRRGHAIEVRLYAEDAARDFMPAPGTLKAFHLPHLPGVRCENGYKSGNNVSGRYDPMIAKIIAWGEDRAQATHRLIGALQQARISGLTTNRSFLLRVLQSPAFARGHTTTSFIRDYASEIAEAPLSADALAQCAAAFMLVTAGAASALKTEDAREYSAWTNPNVAGLR